MLAKHQNVVIKIEVIVNLTKIDATLRYMNIYDPSRLTILREILSLMGTTTVIIYTFS